ncbi:MAG: MBL fold metallo-hydrolase [Archangium sp.]|nr:MBL fold metallo-hydrolase [Archangium sp.]
MRSWLVVSIALVACSPRPLRVPTREEVRIDRIVLSPEIELAKVADDVWIHTSYKELPNVGLFPSNGLVIAGDGGVVLIDTPWTPTATKALLEWTTTKLKLPVTDLIATHSHDDRIGGVGELPPTTRVHALQLTIDRARAEGTVLNAEPITTEEAHLTLAGVRFDTVFPGHGHAPDNLLVRLPRPHQIVFGGCWVKSAASTTLGNVADADLRSWKRGLQTTGFGDDLPFCAYDRRPFRPLMVVPGHGGIGGSGLFLHTLDLVDAALAATPR